MNREEKYKLICSMKSDGQFTAGKYPSKAEFFRALREGRVCGKSEDKEAIIISNSCYKQYHFTKKEEDI